MMSNRKAIFIAAIAAIIGGTVVARAIQTNYLGTVFIADSTTPTQQLKVNADGSLNVDSGGTSYSPIASSAQYGLTIATAKTLTVPSGATFATVQAVGQTVSYTTDGTTPTASTGQTLTAGQYLYLQSNASIVALPRRPRSM
jgi:hypothetical protein